MNNVSFIVPVKVQVMMSKEFKLFLVNHGDEDLHLSPMELFGYNTGTFADKGIGWAFGKISTYSNAGFRVWG